MGDKHEEEINTHDPDFRLSVLLSIHCGYHRRHGPGNSHESPVRVSFLSVVGFLRLRCSDMHWILMLSRQTSEAGR